MSRSRQAFRPGRHLSDVTAVGAELVYNTGAAWHLNWTDGPVRKPVDDRIR